MNNLFCANKLFLDQYDITQEDQIEIIEEKWSFTEELHNELKNKILG